MCNLASLVDECIILLDMQSQILKWDPLYEKENKLMSVDHLRVGTSDSVYGCYVTGMLPKEFKNSNAVARMYVSFLNHQRGPVVAQTGGGGRGQKRIVKRR